MKVKVFSVEIQTLGEIKTKKKKHMLVKEIKLNE